MRVAIHRRIGEPVHSGSWKEPWAQACEARGLDCAYVDCLTPDGFRKALKADVLLYHFGNYHPADMSQARSVLYAAREAGLAVFPDVNEAWHFDDKVAQAHLLAGIGAPAPDFRAFFSNAEAAEWIRNQAVWPWVAKLRNGSGSHNVELLASANAAHRFCRSMFGRGRSSAPGLVFKTTSNLRSARDLSTFFQRARRIPEFARTLRNARLFPRERGYFFLQAFVPNDGFDIKLVVVNNKASYFLRRTRPGDFRASGGADFFYDRNLIPENAIASAFEVSRQLGLRCMGFDYVIDRDTGKGYIVEMSYGFNHRAIHAAGGHWDGDLTWQPQPLDTPAELVDCLASSQR